MMPMFLVRSSGYCDSTALPLPLPSRVVKRRVGRGVSPPPGISSLPAVMRERLVGLRHLVRVFSLLHSGAAVVRRVQQLPRQLRRHALLRPPPRRPDQPAHAEGGASVRPHLDRNLVRGTADPPRLDLDGRLAVVHRGLEELERLLLGAVLHGGHGVVHDPLGDTLLAAVHHHVDELRHQPTPMLGIRQDLAPRRSRSPHLRRYSPSAAWRRTWTGSASGPPRRRCPASPG